MTNSRKTNLIFGVVALAVVVGLGYMILSQLQQQEQAIQALASPDSFHEYNQRLESIEIELRRLRETVGEIQKEAMPTEEYQAAIERLAAGIDSASQNIIAELSAQLQAAEQQQPTAQTVMGQTTPDGWTPVLVREGDTLYDLMSRFGVRLPQLGAIIEYNEMSSPHLIFPGQIVWLPLRLDPPNGRIPH